MAASTHTDPEKAAASDHDSSTVSIEKEAPGTGAGQPEYQEVSAVPEEKLGGEKASLSLRKTRSSAKKANVVVEKYPENDLENGIVGWEGQDDPSHPRNYPQSRKWMILGFVSGITFLSPLASTMPAPGVGYMDETFHNKSQILSSFTISIFILGFSIGPLILSPLSEIYGRRPVLTISNFFLTIWQLAAALSPNLGAIIAFRLLGGLGGSACLAIGGGVIADLFPVEERGLANSMWVVGPLFGPVLGPILGGFISERAGWRWVYWVLFMACSAFSVGFIFVGQESNAASIIRFKTQKLRKETGREDLRSAYDQNKSPAELQVRTILIKGICRPFIMMFGSPMLPLLAIYLSFVFGLIYLIFTTITPLMMNSYGWDVELCGLAYLPVGLGFMLGMVVVAKTSDSTVIRLTAANKGVYQPEMRLASCLYFAPFIPISFFWYGWSADKHTHWIVPLIGMIPFGFGSMGIFAAIQTYFIDATLQYAASAMAGLTLFRCLFAAFLPLAAPKMYAALGNGWGNSLLGFVALGLIPAPAIIYKYGGTLRKKYPIKTG